MSVYNAPAGRRRRIVVAAILMVPGVFVAAPAGAADVPNIAAASDLQFVLQDIAAEFTRATGREVRIAFGSSGNFRRQIAEGAPFELFLSADAAYVDALAREGRTVDAGAVYAIGRLALYTPHGSPIVGDAELRDLDRALDDGRLVKFAIANPEHAPYGRAARQVLMHAGLWSRVEPRLVLGENVSQAAQFVASGAAQAGIIAYSLTRAPALAERGTAVVLSAATHEPLLQKMVLLKGAGATARAFRDFLDAPTARALFERYGFQQSP